MKRRNKNLKGIPPEIEADMDRLQKRNKIPRKEVVLTPNQTKFASLIKIGPNCIGGFGPAGTGKTMVALVTALNLLKSGEIDKIVAIKPLVEAAGENVGFLPGDITGKAAPHWESFKNVLEDHGLARDSNKICYVPIGFLRGRTFDNSIILFDEVQNATMSQLHLVLTRIGAKSKIILTGDSKQNDRDRPSPINDWRRTMSTLKFEYKEVEFGKEDIKRSPFVKRYCELFDL